MAWEAGQSMNFEVQTTLGWEERWFTISSAPYESDIAITTRISTSRYKQALKALKVGDTVRASGLTGDFTWRNDDRNKLLIAKGMGITPYHSMLKQRRHDGDPADAHLLYFTDDPTIPFQQELDTWADTLSGFGVSYAKNADVSLECISQLIADWRQRTVYLCGPERMVGQLGDDLISRGLPPDQLLQDWLSGLR